MIFDMRLDTTGLQGGADVKVDTCLDYEVFVMEACERLASAGAAFRVGGFGDSEWYVDVGYDLATVVEQLPGVFAALREGSAAKIDFYAQGMERVVTISPHGPSADLRCASRTSWIPDPDRGSATFADVVSMLGKLRDDFLAGLEAVGVEVPASYRRALGAEPDGADGSCRAATSDAADVVDDIGGPAL